MKTIEIKISITVPDEFVGEIKPELVCEPLPPVPEAKEETKPEPSAKNVPPFICPGCQVEIRRRNMYTKFKNNAWWHIRCLKNKPMSKAPEEKPETKPKQKLVLQDEGEARWAWTTYVATHKEYPQCAECHKNIDDKYEVAQANERFLHKTCAEELQ